MVRVTMPVFCDISLELKEGFSFISLMITFCLSVSSFTTYFITFAVIAGTGSTSSTSPVLFCSSILAHPNWFLSKQQEAKTEMTLRDLGIKFERFDLVICDELGYVGFDKDSAEMLFNHLSLRTGGKLTILTTNLRLLDGKKC